MDFFYIQYAGNQIESLAIFFNNSKLQAELMSLPILQLSSSALQGAIIT